MKRTYILVILDGWGIGEKNESNPIYIANPETINFIKANFPAGAIQASGIAVGLPWEEEGNSEVGHLTIGAGKILYQHYPRISLAIDDGTFFENPALKQAFVHARKNNSAVHLIGLLTAGSVHASLKHLTALTEMAKKENNNQIYLHLFSDGVDSPPRSVLNLLEKLKIPPSTLAGRYYAMNREENWDRTEKAYKILFGEGQSTQNLKEEIKKNYDRGIDDQFMPPLIIGESRLIKDNDALIFFNFREDSIRQLAEPFLNPDFKQFPIKPLNNIFAVTLTQYRENFRAAVAFPNETVTNPLGKVLADNQKIQLRIAETEKYAHVTQFFNGLREAPFPNEYRVLIPSQNVIHQEERPEMMAAAITDRAITAINEGGFDFILINYANPDIIAHTGNFQATVTAIKTVDRELNKLIKSVLGQNGVLIITADHGNAETLVDLKTGQIETKHNINPVPIYLIAKEFQRKKTDAEIARTESETIGILSDVAPTILELMKIPQPPEMTGQSLLNQFL